MRKLNIQENYQKYLQYTGSKKNRNHTLIRIDFGIFFAVTSKVISIGGDFLEGRAIPLWILLLAVLAGLVFLALVSLILWHCGFFRRDRHPNDQHQMQNGSVIHANEVYLHEAASAHEKEPLAASVAAASTTATITRLYMY